MCCSFATVSVDLPDALEESFFDCATTASENVRGRVSISAIFFIIFRFCSMIHINSGNRGQSGKGDSRVRAFRLGRLEPIFRADAREK